MGRLTEATKSENVVIYQDDRTGKRYYWNGTELVYLNTSNPQIGQKGNRQTIADEDAEREKQIEKERQEAEAKKAAGEDYDESALIPESSEAAQQRIKDIQNILEDETVLDKAYGESKNQVERDMIMKKAADMGRTKNSKIQQFNKSLDLFLAREVRKRRRSTWAKPNMSYEGSGIIRKGRRIEKADYIPKINVYFDQSSSWSQADIEVGFEAIGVLKNYQDRGEIKVNLFYFADHVADTNDSNIIGGATTAGGEIMRHIHSTKPDNVIIMTDSDMDYDGFPEMFREEKAVLPGAVWYLFRNEVSKGVQEWIKGRKQNWAFLI